MLRVDREGNMIIKVMCFLKREVRGTMIVARVQQTQDEVISHLSLSFPLPPTNNSSAWLWRTKDENNTQNKH